jgi:hypothetical protein
VEAGRSEEQPEAGSDGSDTHAQVSALEFGVGERRWPSKLADDIGRPGTQYYRSLGLRALSISGVSRSLATVDGPSRDL